MNEYTFVISLVVLVLVYRIIALALKRRSGSNGETAAASPASETELLRELHQGLARMEKRVEALETLLTGQEDARQTAAGEKRK